MRSVELRSGRGGAAAAAPGSPKVAPSPDARGSTSEGEQLAGATSALPVSPRAGATISSSGVAAGGGAGGGAPDSSAASASVLTSPAFTFVVLLLLGLLGLRAHYSVLGGGGGPGQAPVWGVVRGQGWCAFGNLPGTWVSGTVGASGGAGNGTAGGPGTHWRLLDARCSLANLLPLFARPHPPQQQPAAGGVAPVTDDPPLTLLDAGRDVDEQLAVLLSADARVTNSSRGSTSSASSTSSTRSGSGGGGGGDTEPSASVLFISDSVDRHVMYDLCEWAEGQLRALVLPDAVAMNGLADWTVGAGQPPQPQPQEQAQEQEQGGQAARRRARALLLGQQQAAGGDEGQAQRGRAAGDHTGRRRARALLLERQGQGQQYVGQEQGRAAVAVGAAEAALEALHAAVPRQQRGQGQQRSGQGQEQMQAAAVGVVEAALEALHAAVARQKRGQRQQRAGQAQTQGQEQAAATVGAAREAVEAVVEAAQRRVGVPEQPHLGREAQAHEREQAADVEAAQVEAAAATARRRRRMLPSVLSGVSAANASGYVVNTCVALGGRLRLLAAHTPGVHPTGPFHKQRPQPARARVDAAALVWRALAPGMGVGPDVVVVSSTLWDLARMSTYEPHLVSTPELPLSTLSGWATNYSALVGYAKEVIPGQPLYVFHTTMAPKYDALTGTMDKGYLGHANHIRQLNAAGCAAAATLGMEVLDYGAVAARFLEGQSYLEDLIHPGSEVALELANIYLNYAAQAQQQAQQQQQQRQQAQHAGHSDSRGAGGGGGAGAPAPAPAGTGGVGSGGGGAAGAGNAAGGSRRVLLARRQQQPSDE
ncbi:hypothetical protein FOA52_011413 [Chlamydomonas sp. UWO 241]|nr:hypothetical protein FOA52_011413 [Chlamydomonas sp. UWO 241]